MHCVYEPFIPYDNIDSFLSGEARRAWLDFGCHYIEKLSCRRFLLWAPSALEVRLLLGEREHPMEKICGGCWCCFVHDPGEGTAYKFSVTGADGIRRIKSDPFAMYSRCRENTDSLIWRGGAFSWTDGEYMRRRAERDHQRLPMSVYEVHLGSWRAFDASLPIYRAAADSLAGYCRDMGYTHVELLPIMEHPYDPSWGYQVTGYFAPTSRYGDPDDFKYFVDKLHAFGIGLILDWVPAHFPADGHGLALFDGTPLFECKDEERRVHPHWGSLVFDYSSIPVQSFLISSACMFAEEYHVDGLRVDAVSSMLCKNFGREYDMPRPEADTDNLDADAAAFLQRLNKSLHENCPGFITVAEESAAVPGITVKGGENSLGFDYKWNMGFMHDTLDYMGQSPYMRRRFHEKLTFSMMYAFTENFVLAYSHDEVVHGKGSMLEKMPGSYARKFASLRLLYAWQFCHPGKKLCFMGSEFGQLSEWDHDSKLDWLLCGYPRHRKLRDFYRELNGLYSAVPALHRIDGSWEGFMWLNADDRENSSAAFMRMSPRENSQICCVFNFSAQQLDDLVIDLPAPGRLEELISSDEQRFGGSGILNTQSIETYELSSARKHSARISIAPLSARIFSFILRKE